MIESLALLIGYLVLAGLAAVGVLMAVHAVLTTWRGEPGAPLGKVSDPAKYKPRKQEEWQR